MKHYFTLTIAFFYLLLTAACGDKHESHQQTSESYYTCPMHTTVISKMPGVCPVCNMSLVKVDKKVDQHAQHQGNFVTIDIQKQQLAGIKTDTVRLRDMFSGHTVLGTVAIDEEQVKIISSRARGRIDKLFLKTTGVYVKSGEPLYSIYSEQLQSDEKEYIVLVEKSREGNTKTAIAADLLEAAKNKLILWGLTQKQISELELSGKVSPLITFFSPATGYVSEVNVTKGMYVEEGSTIIKITSLNKIWVEAQLYSNEISSFSGSRSFQISPDDNPDDVYSGTLVYSSPVIEEGKRIFLLKIRVDNTKGRLVPGALVKVVHKESSSKVLAVPKSAVLLEKMKTVWVVAANDRFEQRMVETGIGNSSWVEILSGLKPREVIVTEGAYLLSSEFILKNGAGLRHDH